MIVSIVTSFAAVAAEAARGGFAMRTGAFAGAGFFATGFAAGTTGWDFNRGCDSAVSATGAEASGTTGFATATETGAATTGTTGVGSGFAFLSIAQLQLYAAAHNTAGPNDMQLLCCSAAKTKIACSIKV
ncbi:hypothetical protein ACT009_12350 [Sphingomonas sp. Tas61C01]|uniref:hypothetical protein n=1 Tax=Sphingomonas sp. Tas61C01 TaxID=3458297 RepID=UPI00403E5100